MSHSNPVRQPFETIAHEIAGALLLLDAGAGEVSKVVC